MTDGITADVKDLLARCRNVGATFRPCKAGGVQIRLPDSDVIVFIPPIRSEARVRGRTLRNVESQLRRAGLEELENAKGIVRTRPKRLTKQGQVTEVGPTRACGVFEPDLKWLTTPTNEPQTCWMRITPEVASVLLSDRHNQGNRPWVSSHGGTIYNAITDGQWRRTHQGIAIDSSGLVQDGRHRCQAIVDSGIAVVLHVSVGMDPDNFMVLDENLPRRALDLIARDGVPGASKIAATIKLIEAWLRPDDGLGLATRHRRRITNTTSHNLWVGERDSLIVAADVGKRVRAGAPGINAGSAAAAHYLVSLVNGRSNLYVELFFEGLASGTHESRVALDDNDPRTLLRRLMLNRKVRRQRVTTMEQLRDLIVCWNKVVADDRTGFAQPRNATVVPEIAECLDRGPNAAQTPELFIDGP